MGANLNENENQSSEKVSDDLEDISLTVKEAAKYIGETPHVVRNWLRELKSHVPTNKGENGYHLFDRNAIEQLLLIQQLSREQGYSLKQIEHHLATGGEYIANTEPAPNATDKIMEKLDSVSEQLQQQQQFNQALLEKLEEQRQSNEEYKRYIAESLDKRDQQLLETLEESRAAKQEAAAESKEKKSFWGRLFGSD